MKSPEGHPSSTSNIQEELRGAAQLQHACIEVCYIERQVCSIERQVCSTERQVCYIERQVCYIERQVCSMRPSQVGQVCSMRPSQVGQVCSMRPSQVCSMRPGQVGQVCSMRPGQVGQVCSMRPGLACERWRKKCRTCSVSACARMCQPVRTPRHLTCILCLHVMYLFHGGCSVCGSDSMRTVYSCDAAYPATRKCALADHMVRLREPALSC